VVVGVGVGDQHRLDARERGAVPKGRARRLGPELQEQPVVEQGAGLAPEPAVG
jgi:hypothetical protein